MNLKRCFFCNKMGSTPWKITEINENGSTQTIHMCQNCGKDYMSDVFGPTSTKSNSENLDLTSVETPEQLLDFITHGIKTLAPKPPCECGWTEKDFTRHGRMGCPKCYDHFQEKMEQIVFPYHGANEHVGKYPKAQVMRDCENNPVEKLKLLKLRMAKAIELEEYERAAEIKLEIDQITN